MFAILDAIDGEGAPKPYLTGFDGETTDQENDSADSRKEDFAESGLADMDGVIEELPHLFHHCNLRVEA